MTPENPAGLREIEDAMLAIANLPLTKERGDHLLTVIRAALDAAPARPSGLLREAALEPLKAWMAEQDWLPTSAVESILIFARAALAATEPGLDEALEHDCRIIESALRQVNSAAADASWAVIRAALAATEPGLGDGVTTDCPQEGVHNHPFRGPHRFTEWYAARLKDKPGSER